MTSYYNCFNKIISVKLYKESSDMLDFWLKRFCPSIIKIKNIEKLKIDLEIIVSESKKIDYSLKNNMILLFGCIGDNISYIAKFVTQCFQKLLIKENILIIPAACVAKNNNAVIITI